MVINYLKFRATLFFSTIVHTFSSILPEILVLYNFCIISKKIQKIGVSDCSIG